MGSVTALPEIFNQGFQDFVIPEMVAAPYSSVQNRARVSNSLKAIAGVERIPCRGLSLLQNEFGPTGEPVYELLSKDARVRLVGFGWRQASDTNGTYVRTDVVGNYAEVTFYGTGLNILTNSNLAGTRITVDAGAESAADLIPASGSTLLNNRQYNANIVINAASGLALGWHTIKFRCNTPAILFFGLDIVNERSNIAVTSGKAIAKGSSVGLSTLSTSAFKQGISGVRGGRVVKYIEQGMLKTAVQETDAVAKFMNNADHSNEEVVRRIFYREFGANRADDFSTLSTTASNRYFTLEDGITTLTCSSMVADSAWTPFQPGIAPSTTNAYWDITFVGTGLDIAVAGVSSATYDNHSMIVNGTVVSTTVANSADTKIFKIASGLPYGTHTVRLLRTAATGSSLVVSDFIIYQPKKPAIPAGAFEVADYNVMADFIPQAAAVNSNVLVSTGTLRKMNAREMHFVGTWTGTASTNYAPGAYCSANTAGAYVEYSFWGTGVSYSFGNNAGAQSFTVSVDGSTNLSTLSASLVATAGLALTAATGVVTGSPAASVTGNYLNITGLPLGLHKIRIAWTSGLPLFVGSFDVITPIHINDSSLKVGSLSLKANQNFDVVKTSSKLGPDLSKAKAWCVFNRVDQTVLASYNISAVLANGTGNAIFYLEKPFKNREYAILAFATSAETSVNSTSIKSNSFELASRNSGGTASDSQRVFVACFGELIDE